MNKHIVVTITPEGETIIEAVGFRGDSCAKATAAIEKALGVPGKRTKKPDWFQQNNQTQKAGQG